MLTQGFQKFYGSITEATKASETIFQQRGGACRPVATSLSNPISKMIRKGLDSNFYLHPTASSRALGSPICNHILLLKPLDPTNLDSRAKAEQAPYHNPTFNSSTPKSIFPLFYLGHILFWHIYIPYHPCIPQTSSTTTKNPFSPHSYKPKTLFSKLNKHLHIL